MLPCILALWLGGLLPVHLGIPKWAVQMQLLLRLPKLGKGSLCIRYSLLSAASCSSLATPLSPRSERASSHEQGCPLLADWPTVSFVRLPSPVWAGDWSYANKPSFLQGSTCATATSAPAICQPSAVSRPKETPTVCCRPVAVVQSTPSPGTVYGRPCRRHSAASCYGVRAVSRRLAHQ